MIGRKKESLLIFYFKGRRTNLNKRDSKDCSAKDCPIIASNGA
ncbi:unnamed protein product [Larinioides sclopetarius]|uniref:Uncharacterized protein n=1 Tax=Larinioides sclopetarius TaxID=280406 RepID=A0AAV2BAA3_9ARAC